MSRRRRRPLVITPDSDWRCMTFVYLRPVEVARRDRVRRQIQRTKRRAARRNRS